MWCLLQKHNNKGFFGWNHGIEELKSYFPLSDMKLNNKNSKKVFVKKLQQNIVTIKQLDVNDK
jgi:hypothetical protein